MKSKFAMAAFLGWSATLFGQDPDSQQQQIRQLQEQLRILQSAQAQAQPQSSPNSPAQPKLEPKRADVKRIAVAFPKAQLGSNPAAATAGESIRQMLIQDLTGPGVELIPLAARIPTQITAEAKQKECDFVLETEVALARKGGGSLGKLMHAAQPAASIIPLGGLARGVGGVVAATATAATVGTLAGITGDVQAKDEVTFTYRLTADSQVAATKSVKRTAKTNGEDILTPLLEQAAIEITATILKQ